MKFKSPTLAEQYERTSPKLRAKCSEFEAWSASNGLPEPVATHIIRTVQEQEDIYWPLIKKSDPSITEQQAKSAARTRFSWHLHGCAVDFREYIYTPTQLRMVLDWFRANARGPEWEFLFHDVGRGKHLHLGVRDHARVGSL